MRHICILASLLLLSSCFDIREEIWIHADGGGRAVFDYNLPTDALVLMDGEEGIRKQVASLIEDAPELRLDSLEITSDDDQTRIYLEASTDSMLALRDLQNSDAFEDLPAAGKGLAGNFDVFITGLEIDMTRRVEMRRALGLATLGIGRNDRENRRVEYIIHLPKPASEHNADRTEDSGRTLIWRRSLGEALSEPIVSHFRAPIPLPWWAIPTAIAGILLPIIGIVLLIRRRRARRRAA